MLWQKRQQILSQGQACHAVARYAEQAQGEATEALSNANAYPSSNRSMIRSTVEALSSEAFPVVATLQSANRQAESLLPRADLPRAIFKRPMM